MSKNKEEKNLTPQSEETVETAAEEVAEAVESAEEKVEAAEKKDKKEKKPKRQRTPEAEKERALNKVKRRKKFKYGTLATIITVVVIAVVVMVNVVCGVLDDRFHWNIDLTSSGLYEISEESKTFLNQLNNDIDMVVMADEDYFLTNAKLKVVSETLDRFKAESNGHISVQYVNMTESPEIVKKYSDNYTGEFKQGDVVVAADSLQRVVEFSDLISTEQSIDYSTYQYVYNYTFKGENSLISAIMGVTDLNPKHVAVINKMNGQDIFYQYETYNYQSLLDLLNKNNYSVTEIDIASDPIDASYDAAILCSPVSDLTEAQIDKLNAYLYNDGEYSKQLIYFAGIYQKELPNLDGFLETWGIKIENAAIYESNDNAAQYVTTALSVLEKIPVAAVGDTTYTAGFDAVKLPFVAPLFRPVTQLFDNNSGRTTKAMLTTADTAFLFPLDATEDFDIKDAETGSYNLAVSATQNFTFENEQHTSTLIAFGSSWMLDAYVSQSSSYSNAEYFVTVMNSLTGKENVVTVADKSLNPTEITMKQTSINAIRIVVIFIIPLLVAVIGIVVFIRRKNK